MEDGDKDMGKTQTV